MSLIIPNSTMLRDPNLLKPNTKPVGPVRCKSQLYRPIFAWGAGINGGMDVASGIEITPVGTPVYANAIGVPALDSSTSNYLTVSDSRLRDLPVKQDFTLFVRAIQYGSGGGQPAIMGWSGTDDIVIYPAAKAEADDSLRVFWRDLGGSEVYDTVSDAGLNRWIVFALRHQYNGASSATDGFMDGRKVTNNWTGDATGSGPFTHVDIGCWNGSQYVEFGFVADVIAVPQAMPDNAISACSRDLYASFYEPA